MSLATLVSVRGVDEIPIHDPVSNVNTMMIVSPCQVWLLGAQRKGVGLERKLMAQVSCARMRCATADMATTIALVANRDMGLLERVVYPMQHPKNIVAESYSV